MNFGGIVKKLFIITIFMSAFYTFHTKAVDLSLDSASVTLRKVSPRNLFLKIWSEPKVVTKNKSRGFFDAIAVPAINDLIATTFFVLAKFFIWLLKLIYSSVYHLTYVFSGITAVLYFFGWTKDALKGTVQASLWCILLPFVLVAILSLVGNSMEENALNGELVNIDTLIWLLGITLLLLLAPMMTYGMVKGDGIHAFAPKMGQMLMTSALLPVAAKAASLIKITDSKLGSLLPSKGTQGGTSNYIKNMRTKERTPSFREAADHYNGQVAKEQVLQQSTRGVKTNNIAKIEIQNTNEKKSGNNITGKQTINKVTQKTIPAPGKQSLVNRTKLAHPANNQGTNRINQNQIRFEKVTANKVIHKNVRPHINPRRRNELR
ncbi:MAG: hypothetical protein JNM93_09160 [Bacteriovoracaceae bacterium]|nr:hypothetical protein [Bacteriovoracaceae bacterium]